MHFAVCIETKKFDDYYNLIPVSFAAVSIEPNQSSKIFYQTVTPNERNFLFSDLAVVTHKFLLFLIHNNATVLVAHDYMYTKILMDQCIERASLSPVNFEWNCTLFLSKQNFCQHYHIFDICRVRNVNISDFEHFKSKVSLHSALMCAELFKSFFTSENDKDLDYGLSLVNEQIFKETDHLLLKEKNV